MTFCLSLLVGVCLPQDGWTESFPGLLAGWMEGRRREHGTALAGMASWIVPYWTQYFDCLCWRWKERKDRSANHSTDVWQAGQATYPLRIRKNDDSWQPGWYRCPATPGIRPDRGVGGLTGRRETIDEFRQQASIARRFMDTSQHC